jgi:hypothetical protein
MRRRINFIFVAAIGFLLAVTSYVYSQTPSFTEKTLPSGRVIKAAGVTQINFKNGSSALMLKYYTDINIDDSAALRKEVEDIWQSFRADIEDTGISSAIISANEMPKGIISKTRGYNFVFTKNKDGSWSQSK